MNFQTGAAMATFNKVMLIGRLGRDPELRYSSNGVAVCILSLATDESFFDAQNVKVERVEWHRVVVYGKRGEACERHLGKGSLVHIDGSLSTRKWQDQDGQDRYTTEVKAADVQFLSPKSQGLTGDAAGHAV